MNLDFEAGARRFEDTYLYLTEIPDLSVKAECQARLLSSLLKAHEEQSREISPGLDSLVQADLTSSITLLRDKTAHHEHVFGLIIRSLAPTCLQLAVDVAISLNIEPRRDDGLLAAVQAVAYSESGQKDLMSLREVIPRIVDPEKREKAILTLLKGLLKKGPHSEQLSNSLLPYVPMIDSMTTKDVKCEAFHTLYVLLTRIRQTGFGKHA